MNQKPKASGPIAGGLADLVRAAQAKKTVKRGRKMGKKRK